MTKLQTFIAKLFRFPEAPKGVPIPRQVSDFRLAEWRKTAALVEAAKNLAKNQTYKLQLEVLNVESPGHIVLAFGVSANDRLVQQARTEGYAMCLANLEAFAKPLKLSERLESTFEPPEQPKKK